jgi:hypothetical protein
MAKTTIGNQAAAALSPPDEKLSTLEMTPEAREEELIERENDLAAREERLAKTEARMIALMERLERTAGGTKTEEDLADEPKVEYDAQGREIPRLDMDMPYGTVIGDSEAGFVQNGHRFTKDRRYLCEEPKGVGKPFNIKMLGLVKVINKAA